MSTFSDLSPLFTQRGFKVKPWLSSARSVTSPHTHTVSFPSDRGEDVSLTSCCHTHRQEISNLLYCKFSKLHAALHRKMILFLLLIVNFFFFTEIKRESTLIFQSLIIKNWGLSEAAILVTALLLRYVWQCLLLTLYMKHYSCSSYQPDKIRIRLMASRSCRGSALSADFLAGFYMVRPHELWPC